MEQLKEKKEIKKRQESNAINNFLNFFKLDDKKFSAEDSMPFDYIFRNGILKKGNYYNKMLEFEDRNYTLLNEDLKQTIFLLFEDLLNSFDENVKLQFCYTNEKERNKESLYIENIGSNKQRFSKIKKEFKEMLKNQIKKGNQGSKKSKYIVFGIENPSEKEAFLKLNQLESNIIEQFKKMGVNSHKINGYRRLKIIHNLLNPIKEFIHKEDDSILFDKKNQKSCVVPPCFYFKKDSFRIVKNHSKTFFLNVTATELSDNILNDILKINKENVYISFNITPINQSKSLKMVRGKISDLDSIKIDEQKTALKSGYDMDILPAKLAQSIEDVKDLFDELRGKSEKLFLVTIIITIIAKDEESLENLIYEIKSIISMNHCSLEILEYQQEQGLFSSIPIGLNNIKNNRYLTTSSIAIFMPFYTKEIFSYASDSIYYGLNALSNNIIMANRKELKNPNGLILGTPGSGKSFSAKREIANAIITSDDDIIICDPEGEFGSLVQEFKGENIKISAKSKDYLNPLDINIDNNDDDYDPLKDKSNFILSLFEFVVGEKGITAEEKSIIDRCLPVLYQDFFKNPVAKNMPVLGDLYNMLKNQTEKAGKKLATEMEIYVRGSLNVFNNKTNVDINKHSLCFNIKELGSSLKKIGMLVVQEQVWNAVSRNRDKKRSTRYYIDEFHLQLRDQQTATYSVEIWKRFRKWGGIPTGITQNVKDFLSSKEVENILDNTDFILMLNQAAGDRDILAEKLKISPLQMQYVTNTGAGEGLIFFGDTILPFVDNFPKDTILYKKMTTKLDET